MSVAVTFLLTTIMMASILFALGDRALTAFARISETWTDVEERSLGDIQTRLRGPIGLTAKAASTTVEIILTNIGDDPLEQFSKWDVIIETWHSDCPKITYLTYSTTTPPAAGRWAIKDVYLNAASSTPEVVDPDVLNPGEQAVIEVNPDHPLVVNSYNQVMLATPNAVVTRTIFKIEPMTTTTLYVVDDVDDTVYWYSSVGQFLGSSPLDSQNKKSKGITTDIRRFWSADVQDDRVYKYGTDISLLADWPLAVGNTQGEGITTDGCNIWTVERLGSQKVYKYTMNGSSTSDFPLTAGNDHATGLTTDGTHIWVVDHIGAKVYKYTMAGALVSDFTLTGDNANAGGITTDGSNIWSVDRTQDKVYRYSMTGTLLSEFSLTAANGNPEGITVTPR